MHGTPLLSAKGNHDQDYTAEETTTEAAAAQAHYKQQPQYNGSQSASQQPHQLIQQPPLPPVQPQQYQPPPPPKQQPAQAHGNMATDNRSGDNKSIGEIGNAINIVFGLLATRALTYFPILYPAENFEMTPYTYMSFITRTI